MKTNFYIYLILLVLISNSSIAQSNIEKSATIIEESLDKTIDEINENGQEDLPDELQRLIFNPIDINGDVSTLVKYGLISNTQEASLKKYIARNGSLIEMEELQQVDNFDKATIRNIIPFCTIQKISSQESMHQLTIRMQRKINQEDYYYAGSAEKILFRLRSTLSSAWKFSFTGEKDAGEEMFTKKRNGFDFNSFNITYTGKSILKKVILGDYVTEYGQGLTSWQGMSIGGISNAAILYKFGKGALPYSGTDENKFFRGIACSFEKNKFGIDCWVSLHKIDAYAKSDSTEEYISSLQTSGYHRTDFENSVYHSLKESCIGTTLKFNSKNLHLGIVSIAGKYNVGIKAHDQPYNLFGFNGSSFMNSGFYFDYTYKNIFFFGEITGDDKLNIAFINGVAISLDSRVSLGWLFRNYPKDFMSLKSNAFGVNTANNNEQGNLIVINYKLTKSLGISTGLDIYTFEFIKYRVDRPTIGHDFISKIDFVPNKKITAQLSYRNRLKQQNETLEQKFHEIADNHIHAFRISSRIKIDNTWEVGFRANYEFLVKAHGKNLSASVISENLFFHPPKKKYSVNISYSIFDCPDFETRIYGYENDLPGAFSLPFFYKSGCRFYLNLNYKFTRSLTFSARYSTSWYTNNEEPQQTAQEIKAQIRLTIK